MKKLYTLSVLIVMILAFSVKVNAQGHEIKVKIDGLKDTVLILGYHMDGKMLSDDTARVNKRGEAVFKGDELKAGGMYFVFMPSKEIFNVLIGKDQHFSVKTTKEKYLDNLKFSGSDINEDFYNYEQYLKGKGKEMKSLTEEYKAAKDEDAKKKVQEKMKALNEEVEEHQNKIIEENKGNFLAKFIHATQPLNVPDAPESITDDTEKQRWKYQYYKSHFFDNFDFSDSSLLRTAVFKPKLTEFLEKVIIQIPDSVINDLDWVIKRSKQNPEVFKYVLGTCYNHYNRANIMGMDKVWVYLAEYYINGEADWNDEEYVKKLKERRDKIVPNIIGKIAWDFTALTIDKKWMKLSQVKSKYTILMFFEPDCSHCNKEAPKVREVQKRLRKRSVSVIGFFTQADTTEWYKFLDKHEIKNTWVHVWSPHSNEYRDKYNIYSTPTMYLLAEDKEIIAKRINSDQMEKIIIERIISEPTKDMTEDEKLKAFERFMLTCTDTTEVRIVREVMDVQIKEEKNKEALKTFAEKHKQRVLIYDALNNEVGNLQGKEREQKLEKFLTNYNKKEDVLMVKEIINNQKFSEKEMKSLNKLIDRRLKEIKS